ncbi:MAG: acyl-CoA/acyl-ACP dehydrogenase [Fimbriimonadaceae bacterium]|nr:acyl-CoA/acyl-ACP dehydrogenase [Fimbriimonadaceae bacterium]
MNNLLLTDLKSVLEQEIRPLAQEMDHDPTALAKGLAVLAKNGWLALRRPRKFGGPALPDLEFRQFQVAIARYSGALAFLQTQHQSAVSMLSKSKNSALKEAVLPHTHNGERLIGIGFSQLRRPGPPLMKAAAVPGGFRLDGHVPWVTGHGFYPEFLVAAVLPDGQAVFGLVPLANTVGIKSSEPMKLAAMEAAQTVTVDFDGYLLSEKNIVFFQPPDWIVNNDLINISLQGFFALGCAWAGYDLVQSAANRRDTEFLHTTARALSKEIELCTAALEEDPESVPMEERLRRRAWVIDLMARCAHAGVVSSSGAANTANHPAQRVYRESIVFSVSAQTSAIMEATLDRIVQRAGTTHVEG